MTTIAVNTGTPRNVTGHIISGAIASSVIAGALNYNKFQKEEITKEEAIKDTMKLTVQGGIATGSAIAAANYIGNGNWFGMMSAISLGMAGIYAAEKVCEKMNQIPAFKAEELSAIETTGENE